VTEPETGIRVTRLEGGPLVVTERSPLALSAALGVWVDVGSRDEPTSMQGATHLLEHLVFKGTERFDADEISEEIERFGGDINAFTTAEHTVYEAHLIAEGQGTALEILTDLACRPNLEQPDIESEREVVLDELRGADDQAGSIADDLLNEALFPEHPLGRRILGTEEHLLALNSQSIRAYHDEQYVSGRMIVAAAGLVDHDEIVEAVQANIPSTDIKGRPSRKQPGATPPMIVSEDRPGEQTHVLLAARVGEAQDPGRYALTVLSHVLGGGLTSRLFREVREKRGLSYAVGSDLSLYTDAGILLLYATCSPRRAEETASVIAAELEAILTDRPVSEAELERTKAAIRGSFAIADESMRSRMHRIGRSALLQGEPASANEVVQRYEAVSMADMDEVRQRLQASPLVSVRVGPKP